MRRISALLLAMLMTISLNASEVSTQTSTTAVVYSHMPSSYTLLIPSSIVAQSNSNGYEITAQSLDLCEGDRVIVNIYGVNNNEMQLTTQGGKVMTAGFYSYYAGNSVINDGSTIAVFDGSNANQNQGFYVYPKQWQGAGNYYGSLTFDIHLEEEYNIF